MPQRMQRPLVDDHRRRVRAQLGPGHLGQLHVVVDRVDAVGRDHLDALVRAGIDAAIAENAAVAVDEDIELALQAALGFFEADRLGVTDFDLERRVERADAAIRAPAAPASPAGRRRRSRRPRRGGGSWRSAPLGDALGDQRVRRGDELGRDARDLHLADLRLGAAQMLRRSGRRRACPRRSRR